MPKVDPYKVVRQFEEEVAKFCGAKYGVSVESCSAALFLAMKYDRVELLSPLEIPKKTYVSVAAQAVHAGARIRFVDLDWQDKGWYRIPPSNVIDSAKCFSKDMYVKGSYMCVSFHGKKPLHIDRGGMILTDNEDAYKWFRVARFDGRHECPMLEDTYAMAGWNMYMTVGQAARGLERLQWLGDVNIAAREEYQDLSKYDFFRNANTIFTNATGIEVSNAAS